MLNGGHLFPNLYISKKVWFQQGAKLFGQSHKINFCQKLSENISDFKTDMLIHSKNGKDIKLIDFGIVINIQDKLLNNMLILQKDLSKYINLNIQLQQSNQPLSIQDPNMFNLFLDDENDENDNLSSSSSSATTTTATTGATTIAGVTTGNNENENYNIDSSISLSSKVFGFGKSMFKTISNTIKGNAKEETSERPYVPWLIQVFNNIHFIDDWITIYEDLLKEFSSTSKIREIEELKLILERFERISLILHTTLCNFVLQDLQILLERFILKSRDSLSKLFVQKNVPIL
ncbi:predicted protein [Naegleria gruberi]|uniref:Predicted protein n=1 Tax=Naegleria gruberi TaxID=5762 RepID=D2VRJ4_NAEGR|nr:uncharacterized protein NAEGRDRAFT_71606 [Naegleria gruberi]EFC40686.1 predicted protein [Naegleria gruberi]|eukprot:XP_002673430.1 predicted protein [Naegleria gruberi strain NEG-M]